jgi:hypothetical protein
MAMSCPAEGSCTAIGSAGNASQTTQSPVALAQGTTSWTAALLPLPSQPAGTAAVFGPISAMSCQAAGDCTAIGTYTSTTSATGVPASTQLGLIETESGGKWSAMTAPSPVTNTTSVALTSLSCVSAGNCVALGTFSISGVTAELVDTEAAGKWATAILPPPQDASEGYTAYAVFCVSTGNCIATGESVDGAGPHALIYTDNKGNWAGSTVALPGPPGPGYEILIPGLSCFSAGNSNDDCVAAGSVIGGGNQYGIILTDTAGTWTGSNAKLPTGGIRGELTGLACVSSSECTAVGSYAYGTGYGSWIDSDSAGRWTTPASATVTSGNSVSLSSIACSSGGSCAIGGQYVDSSYQTDETLIYGSGTTWTATKPTMPSDASGAYGTTPPQAGACFADNTCVLIGNYVEASDGASEGDLASESDGNWTVVATKNPVVPDPFVHITGESCPAVANCTIDGYYDGGNGLDQPLLEQETDGTWAVSAPLPLPDSMRGILNIGPVSCTAVSECVAVAISTAGSGNPYGPPLVFTENAGTWTVQALSLPTSGHVYSDLQVSGLSCGAPASCVAVASVVAYSSDGAGLVQQGLLFTDSGGTWTTLSACSPTVADPSGTSASYCPYVSTPADVVSIDLGGVSCNSTQCGVVGSSLTGGDGLVGLPGAVTYTYEAGTWTGSINNVAADSLGGADSISCPAEGSCTAVGTFEYRVGSPGQAVLFTLASGTWTESDVTLPGSAVAGSETIDCSAATSCTLFGVYSANGVSAPFFDVDSNGVWKVSTASLPTGAAAGGVSTGGAVLSCAAAGWCEMGGSYRTTTGQTDGLIEDEIGATIEPGTTGLPAGAASASAPIAALACTAARACVAAGSYTTSTGLTEGFVDTINASVTVSHLSATYGPPAGGTVVTIAGSGFESKTGTTTVDFGSVPATKVTVVDDEELTAVSPAQAFGTVSVTVHSQFGASRASLASRYSYALMPTMKVSVSPASVVYGDEEAAKVSVTVTGADSFVPTGTLTLTYGKTKLDSFTLVKGGGAWVVSSLALPWGKDAIVASYSGDQRFVPVSNAKSPVFLTVLKEATLSTLAVSPTTIAVGKEKSLVFVVKVKPKYAGTVVGPASVFAGTKVLCTLTINNGTGRCSPTSASVLAAGTYSVKATYAGGTGLIGSTSKAVTLKVT